MRKALLVLLMAAAPPAAPPINEPAVDGQLCNPADVHMEAGPFSDPDPGDTHASTDWSIWKVSTSQKVWEAVGATGLDALHIHFADGQFVGPYAGLHELEYDVDYRLEVRFRDQTGAASPVSARLFRTSPAGPPGLALPLPWIPAEHGYRVEAVASGFRLPVNVAFVPSPGPGATDPLFYVAELYGTVKVVRRNGAVSTYASGLLNYDPTALGSFPGAGEQGLAGLCIEPASGDLFVTLLYQFDASTRYPKVARLHSADGGLTMSTNTTILDMAGEPQGQSHQISNCTIGPDGKLYVHMGDGFDWTTAGNLGSYHGKILRMNLDGTPPSDNPSYDGAPYSAADYVWAYGLRNPFGGAWRASTGEHYEVENGPSRDRFARVLQGRNFGWNNTNAGMDAFAIYNWNPSHAPVNLAFVEPQTFAGSGFPGGKMDRAYVTTSGPTYASGPQANGKRIVEFAAGAGDAAASPTSFVEYAGTGKATCAALAAGPDGLYFSDLYKDQGAATPSEAGANVLRVRYVGPPTAGAGAGFRGEYFDTPDLTGPAVVRDDPAVDFAWGTGQPHPSIGAETFSVRWSGKLKPWRTDTVTFYVLASDGARLRVNGTLLIDQWSDHATAAEFAGSIALQEGVEVDVVLEYYDNTGDATARLRWSGPANPKEAVPTSQVSAPDLRDNDGDGTSNTLDLDDDGDGTPDNADADRDGDGATNAAELAAGTDPDDKTSVPAASSSSSSGGGGCGLTGLEPLLVLLGVMMSQSDWNIITFRTRRGSRGPCRRRPGPAR